MTDTSQPVASVIIPSSGRPLCLEETLDALCHQVLGTGPFEVIVADDGSAPPLHVRLARYQSRLRLRVVRLETHGASAARNAAAALAIAPLLLFLDDDCVPAPGWVATYLLAYAAHPESALVGPLANGTRGSLGAEAYHLIFAYLYARHMQPALEPAGSTKAPFMLSANFGVGADLFHSVGGFDESFRIAAEDREFSERWIRSGRHLLALPDAVVQHRRPLKLTQFLRQQFRFGRGRTMLQRAMQQRGWAKHGIESSSFYVQLVTFPFRTSCEGDRRALMLLLFLSQFCTAAGALYEKLFAPVRHVVD